MDSLLSVELTIEDKLAKTEPSSDGSTMRDVSVIINHSILSEEDFLCDVKKKVNDRIQISNPHVLESIKADCDEYQSAVTLLKEGFIATKINYNNTKTRKVTI